ncbi:hypothetical protein GGX14DRAFT_622215 [Mycena pura]|uniref:Uncharacterized protein n=1 Tax=Mycena pura TaxID=153505 RepID=A0AAD6VK78_9AGAR|nr:hypothetical protein GGX14DRAFT_622215 [Mycena pura]
MTTSAAGSTDAAETASGGAGPPPIVLYSRALQVHTLRLWVESLKKAEERRRTRLIQQASPGCGAASIDLTVKTPKPPASPSPSPSPSPVDPSPAASIWFFLSTALHCYIGDRAVLRPAQHTSNAGQVFSPQSEASSGSRTLRVSFLSLRISLHRLSRTRQVLPPAWFLVLARCPARASVFLLPPTAVLITAVAVLVATTALIAAAAALLIAALPLPPCRAPAAVQAGACFAAACQQSAANVAASNAHVAAPYAHAAAPVRVQRPAPLSPTRAHGHPMRTSLPQTRTSPPRTRTPPLPYVYAARSRVLTAAPAHDDAHVAATNAHVAAPYVHVVAPYAHAAATTLHQMAQSRLCDRAPITCEATHYMKTVRAPSLRSMGPGLGASVVEHADRMTCAPPPSGARAYDLRGEARTTRSSSAASIWFFLSTALHCYIGDRAVLRPAQHTSNAGQVFSPQSEASSGSRTLRVSFLSLRISLHRLSRTRQVLPPAWFLVLARCPARASVFLLPPTAVLITAVAVLVATTALIAAAAALLIAALPLPPCRAPAAVQAGACFAAACQQSAANVAASNAHVAAPYAHAAAPVRVQRPAPLSPTRAHGHPMRTSLPQTRTSPPRTRTPPLPYVYAARSRVLTAAPAHDDAHVAATNAHVAAPYVHVVAPYAHAAATTLHQMAQSRLCDRAPITCEATHYMKTVRAPSLRSMGPGLGASVVEHADRMTCAPPPSGARAYDLRGEARTTRSSSDVDLLFSPHLLPLPAVRLLSHLLRATSVASTFTFACLATPVLRTLILTPATSAMGTSSCVFPSATQLKPTTDVFPVMMKTVTRLSTGSGDAEKAGRKHVVRTLGGAVPGSALRCSDSLDSDASDTTAVESTVEPDPKQAQQDPALTLLILDGRERAWKPHAMRTDVEDFLSHLVDDGEPRWRKTAVHIAVKTTTGRITLHVPSALIAVHAASTLALHVVCLCSSRPITHSWPWKMDGLNDFMTRLRIRAHPHTHPQ